jgi:hypothetical protein
MAKIKLNPIIERLRGAVGDLVFKARNGRPYVARKADLSDYAPSQAQAAQRDRFRDATAYARASMDDPDANALYAALAKGRGLTAYTAAVTDFLVAPTISEIDVSAYGGLTGGIVAVRARDEFGVLRVHVSITDATGQVIEAGNALQTGNAWLYTATSDAPSGESVTVRAQAFDRPGNVVEDSLEVAIPT